MQQIVAFFFQIPWILYVWCSPIDFLHCIACTHSYIMSKNLAFPERIYICLVDLRGNKSETCHTNETRMRHFLVPNGNDHARAIESILNYLSTSYLSWRNPRGKTTKLGKMSQFNGNDGSTHLVLLDVKRMCQ